MAGLWHTQLAPATKPLIFEDLRKVYDGPVVQLQDLTVFNLTKEAVVARQAQVEPHPPRRRPRAFLCAARRPRRQGSPQAAAHLRGPAALPVRPMICSKGPWGVIGKGEVIHKSDDRHQRAGLTPSRND